VPPLLREHRQGKCGHFRAAEFALQMSVSSFACEPEATIRTNGRSDCGRGNSSQERCSGRHHADLGGQREPRPQMRATAQLLLRTNGFSLRDPRGNADGTAGLKRRTHCRRAGRGSGSTAGEAAWVPAYSCDRTVKIFKQTAACRKRHRRNLNNSRAHPILTSQRNRPIARLKSTVHSGVTLP
jgi:hypothetical protein